MSCLYPMLLTWIPDFRLYASYITSDRGNVCAPGDMQVYIMSFTYTNVSFVYWIMSASLLFSHFIHVVMYHEPALVYLKLLLTVVCWIESHCISSNDTQKFQTSFGNHVFFYLTPTLFYDKLPKKFMSTLLYFCNIERLLGCLMLTFGRPEGTDR